MARKRSLVTELRLAGLRWSSMPKPFVVRSPHSGVPPQTVVMPIWLLGGGLCINARYGTARGLREVLQRWRRASVYQLLVHVP